MIYRVIKFVISIDIGLDGGICCRDLENKKQSIHSMPVKKIQLKNGKQKREVDFEQLYKLLLFFKNKGAVVIFEKLQGIFGVSKKSACSLMEQYGHLKAFCIALGLEAVSVYPKQWQSVIFKQIENVKRKGKAGKDKSIIVNDTKAMASIAWKKYFKKNLPTGPRGRVLDGCVDAALIGLYYRACMLNVQKNTIL